jgi:hypothetical protein
VVAGCPAVRPGGKVSTSPGGERQSVGLCQRRERSLPK